MRNRDVSAYFVVNKGRQVRSKYLFQILGGYQVPAYVRDDVPSAVGNILDAENWPKSVELATDIE